MSNRNLSEKNICSNCTNKKYDEYLDTTYCDFESELYPKGITSEGDTCDDHQSTTPPTYNPRPISWV